VKGGVLLLPCVGDGRQSGTSASPSILNASPEAAVGGGLALLKTGDKVRVDIGKRRADILIPEKELAERKAAWKPHVKESQTPWQELQRKFVGQLASGACLDFAVNYQRIVETKGVPRTRTDLARTYRNSRCSTEIGRSAPRIRMIAQGEVGCPTGRVAGRRGRREIGARAGRRKACAGATRQSCWRWALGRPAAGRRARACAEPS
jgi:hypothetical protein